MKKERKYVETLIWHKEVEDNAHLYINLWDFLLRPELKECIALDEVMSSASNTWNLLQFHISKLFTKSKYILLNSFPLSTLEPTRFLEPNHYLQLKKNLNGKRIYV